MREDSTQQINESTWNNRFREHGCSGLTSSPERSLTSRIPSSSEHEMFSMAAVVGTGTTVQPRVVQCHAHRGARMIEGGPQIERSGQDPTAGRARSTYKGNIQFTSYTIVDKPIYLKFWKYGQIYQYTSCKQVNSQNTNIPHLHT